ncbi:MAG TPA: flagellar motor switch protein FliN [Syntrophales bacterium]|nr:flagellar motor switch protein FliN [Syntrophales bacterium]
MEQSEVDALLSGVAPDQKGDEELSWDDVEKEMEESRKPAPKVEASVAEFEELKRPDRKTGAQLDLDFILDIPLTLSAELGRSKLLISELLQLGQGSVIELSKIAGEPMDIYVNQRLIARGEVVVVNEKFGVRLTDIVSPQERISKLK